MRDKRVNQRVEYYCMRNGKKGEERIKMKMEN